MHNTLLKISITGLLVIASSAISAQGDAASAVGSLGNNQYSKLRGSGMSFTPNKGQIADMDGNPCPDVLYRGDGGGADVYLRQTGISYVYSDLQRAEQEADGKIEELIKAGIISELQKQEKKDELMQKRKINMHRVDMDFENCLPAAPASRSTLRTEGRQAGNKISEIINEDEVDGYQNFYYAHCPQGITNVKQYNKVTYKNIYNNIDVTYYGDKEHGIKYDIIVQPHADPNQIKLHWKGAESIQFNREGNLRIKTSLNEFTESIPKVYQIINGEIVDVKTKYVLEEVRDTKSQVQSKLSGCIEPITSYLIGFSMGTYNSSFPLIIDPWVTYYGGTGTDYGYSVACDNSGSVYLAGITRSPNIGNVIAIAPGFQTIFVSSDAYLVKFNSISGVRSWATYYGGTGLDLGYSVACDINGNVYLAGYTNSPNIGNVIAIAPGFQTFLGGLYDAFVVKFNSSTGVRNWATYYGGTSDDRGYSVTCDNTGNVYLAGYTGSANNVGNVIATASGFQTVFGGGGDAFLVQFNSSTGTRNWATYYGGTGGESGNNVACDNAGSVFLTGSTTSPNVGNVIATVAGFQTVWLGSNDVFLVKFNSNTGVRTWATYYGGANTDYGPSVACDNTGNVYLSGMTDSPNAGNLIASVGAFQSVPGGSFDAFLAKFNSTTGARIWGTYYGSIQGEIVSQGCCLALDGNNNAYLLMEVEDEPAPDLIDACAYQPNYAGGGEDQMIVKFSPVGLKLCATYFGGTGYEDLDWGWGGGIAVSGNLLFICATNGPTGYIPGPISGGYPVTPGAHQIVPGGGGYDAVLASLCINICEGKTSLGLGFAAATSLCANTPITFKPTISNSCDTTGYKYHWVFSGGNPATSDSLNPTVSFAGVGTHDVKLVVSTLCKKDSVTIQNYITTTQCLVCNLVGQFTKGTANCVGCGCKEWVMVNATGGTMPYTYLWPDGYDKRYKNKICPGNYTVKVTDKNGCSVDVNITAP